VIRRHLTTLGDEVVAKLREADEAASIVHDHLCGLNGVSPADCEDAIWRIHNTLRPLIDPSGGEWLRV
jgi:hypothetical protein